MLKTDSYSSEMALAQLEQELFTPCLCFRYFYPFGASSTPTNLIVDGGSIVDVGPDGTCVPTVTGTNPAPPALAITTGVFQREVTNQSCLYKLWMCACWASQVDGCMCARENADATVTMIRPTMGVCQPGSGPLLNPKA